MSINSRRTNFCSRCTNTFMDHQMADPVEIPTHLDVVNGRGQGVYRHPGNEKYRMLVSLHKEIYAMCPMQDKIQVSKGIVAAIRQFGGRFLELNEKSGLYFDIGDNRAWLKTSQALREGQTQIRRSLLRNDSSRRSGHEAGLLGQSIVPAEGYFGYSYQVLEFLYENTRS